MCMGAGFSRATHTTKLKLDKEVGGGVLRESRTLYCSFLIGLVLSRGCSSGFSNLLFRILFKHQLGDVGISDIGISKTAGSPTGLGKNFGRLNR